MSDELEHGARAGLAAGHGSAEDDPRSQGGGRRRRRSRRGYEGRPEWKHENGESRPEGGDRPSEAPAPAAAGAGGSPPRRDDDRGSGRRGGSGGGGDDGGGGGDGSSRRHREESRGGNGEERARSESARTEAPGSEGREGRRERRERREPRGPREPREGREAREPREAREGRSEGSASSESGREPRESAGAEDREPREARGSREPREGGERPGRRRRSRRRPRDRSAGEGASTDRAPTEGGAAESPAESRTEDPAASRAEAPPERGSRPRRGRSQESRGNRRRTGSERSGGGDDSRRHSRGSEGGRDRDRDRSRGSRGAERGGARDSRGRGGRGERGPRRIPVNRERPSGPVVRPTSTLMLPPQPVRVLIAGGGTGGHIIPALSIGEALKRRNPQTEVIFLGSDRGIERDMIAGAGYKLEEFSLLGLPRRPTLGSVRAALAMYKAYRRIRRIIDEFKPGVLVGTGGYVTVPAVVAAHRAGVPVVLQEQNSVPGRANRFLSRYADEIHVHFAESRRFFKQRAKLRLSGNPVRVKISEGRALRTLHKLRLYPDRKTVLVLGGSQGAHSLNLAFIDLLGHFRGDRTVQFVAQTGKEDQAAVLEAVRATGAKAVVRAFFNDMEEIYGIAHLAVARAGAMTISEVSACGIPSILVPYPHAMDDHQTMNGMALSEKGAAVLLPDRELSGERLAEEIRKLLADPRALRDMARNAFALSRPDAARRIAEAVEKLGGGAPQSMLHLPEEYDAEDEDEKPAEKAEKGGKA